MELVGRQELPASNLLPRAVHKRFLCYTDQFLDFQSDYKGILHIKEGKVFEIIKL